MDAGAPRALSGAALPQGLCDLPEPPEKLFIVGAMPPGPRIGIVGTRHPTPEARAYAVQLAARLAERGVAIVSGGAEGIDAAAHEGALQVGGATLVVAPSSFDCPFPEEHGELFARVVASGGGHLSAYEANVKAWYPQFLLRNSFLVALSLALIVVEAPIRSGARNAAKWARRLQRPYFVVPAVPWNAQGEGCIAELKLGGRPLASHADILRWLEKQQLHAISSCEPARDTPKADPATPAQPASPPTPAPAHPKRKTKRAQPAGKAAREPIVDPALQAIVDAMKRGCRNADEIGRTAQLGAAAVSHGLLLLTLQGVVVQSAGDIRLVG
jgi:DNA processing protein